MKTTSQRTAELDTMGLPALKALFLSYSPKASAKHAASIKAMSREQVYSAIFNYELGAALLEWDREGGDNDGSSRALTTAELDAINASIHSLS